jgi:hypothetical protein
MRDYTQNLLPARPTQRGPSAVPLLIVLSLIGWLFIAFTAFAQSSESTSISGAATNTEVETRAIAGSAINNYGQKAGKDARTYQEVATAPSLGGLALGGGHPCAYSPATAQVSLIGGGAGIGGMKVDSACMLMVMGAAGDKAAYKAAQLMLAARDPAACLAMEQAGLVTGCKQPRGSRRDFSASTTPAGVNTGTGAKCEKVGNTITFRPSSAAARDAELAACKARF